MLLNSDEVSFDTGALLLRLTAGVTIFWQHGLVKLMQFGELSTTFPDPIGVGHTLSLTLLLFAELVCAALVVLGLWTRVATIPLIIAMAVAAFLANGDQPFAKQAGTGRPPWRMRLRSWRSFRPCIPRPPVSASLP